MSLNLDDLKISPLILLIEHYEQWYNNNLTKKSKSYLDIYKFNSLSYSNKANILALGGINKNNLKKLKLLKIEGFGGIGMFKKKPAYKRPVF